MSITPKCFCLIPAITIINDSKLSAEIAITLKTLNENTTHDTIKSQIGMIIPPNKKEAVDFHCFFT